MNDVDESFSWVTGNTKGLMLDPSAPTICSVRARASMFVCLLWKVNGSPAAVCNNQCVLGRGYRGGGKWIRREPLQDMVC